MIETDPSIDARLRKAKVIPILRKLPHEKVMAVAGALIEGGASVVEITLDSPGALDAISDLRAHHGDAVLIGAGTVMRSAQLGEALRAGAQFFLSPHLDCDLVRRAVEGGHAFLPGVLTPTEVVQALKAGTTLMKLFPAGALGPAYLKDLLGPFQGQSFFPTGGVTPQNAPDFIRAGAMGVAMGSALLSPRDVERGDWEAIAQSTGVLLARLQAV